MKFILLPILALYTIGCVQSPNDPTRVSALNLDFEQVGLNRSPLRWEVATGKNYSAYLDSVIVKSGKKSLRINFIEKFEEDLFAEATSKLLIDDVLGKKVIYQGYIRTDSLTDGYAGLWFRVDSPEEWGGLGFNDMKGRGAEGTSDWRQYKIELEVDSTATNIDFGVLHTGKGTAWFDKLEILVDGKPYDREIFVPSDEQSEWLKANAKPFSTPVAGSGFDDLTTVKDIVGNAEIVGLGEATHGTKEFFQMKHRLTEFLANNMGYTVFAIEANMPEAYKINDYVLGGQGNVRNLLNGMYFWTWNTREVEALIEWMRAYNISGKGRIEFTGYDMQADSVAAYNVVAFLKKFEKEYARAAQVRYDSIHNRIIAKQMMQPLDEQRSKTSIKDAFDVLTHMQSTDYTKTASRKEISWAIQNANIVLQATQIGLMEYSQHMVNYRDSCMAANIKWIKEHASSNGKLILWAHNGHITRADPSMMGSYLNKMYGNKYRPIGFKFHEGSYTAWRDGSLSSSNAAIPSYPGTLDWVFHSLGLPRFILNLQTTSASDPRTSWLHQKLETKSIGAVAHNMYSFRKAADEFDAIIFFDRTTASECYELSGSP